LLFRDSQANFCPDVDGDLATAQVLYKGLLGYGIETLTHGKPALINFTGNLLLQDLPLLFPRDKIIVEILENIDPSDDILDACRRLIRNGFTLALDDFIFEERYRRMIELAGLIKIDFRAASLEAIAQMLDQMGPTQARLLAEKVETYEEFEQAMAMGFSLFQGYFFSKPEIVSHRDIRPNKAVLLGIIGEIYSDECHIPNLERLLKNDVSLSIKLLQTVNSAFYSRVGNITSLRHALTYLGCRDIKRLVTMIILSDLASDKPAELLRQSLMRARFCELMTRCQTAEALGAEEAFLAGLFASIDALLDLPMGAILEQLPLSEAIKTALLKGGNPLGELLGLAFSYEKGEWDNHTTRRQKLNLSQHMVMTTYLEAIQWADAALAAL
jgi:EAL and modified HD-GYP domain-containing signal transduction protein